MYELEPWKTVAFWLAVVWVVAVILLAIWLGNHPPFYGT